MCSTWRFAASAGFSTCTPHCFAPPPKGIRQRTMAPIICGPDISQMMSPRPARACCGKTSVAHKTAQEIARRRDICPPQSFAALRFENRASHACTSKLWSGSPNSCARAAARVVKKQFLAITPYNDGSLISELDELEPLEHEASRQGHHRQNEQCDSDRGPSRQADSRRIVAAALQAGQPPERREYQHEGQKY